MQSSAFSDTPIFWQVLKDLGPVLSITPMAAHRLDHKPFVERLEIEGAPPDSPEGFVGRTAVATVATAPVPPKRGRTGATRPRGGKRAPVRAKATRLDKEDDK